MTASAMEDKKQSCEKKMEGDGNLRTMECLRGRLIAERQASKVAKEEAETMNSRLLELENKLREETKLRKKAEKRLNFFMKKLESLKISTTLEGSEKSSCSENSGFSFSSSASTSSLKHPEESESKCQSKNSVDMKKNLPETTTSNQTHMSLPSAESSCIQDTSDANSPLDKKFPSSQPSNSEEYESSSSLKASMAEKEKSGGKMSEDEEDFVDNTLALVPVSMAPPIETSELKIVNKSVSEVLDALRHAREKIQSSMERRHLIRVGPV